MSKPKKCKCCGVEFTPFKSTQKFIDVHHEKNWLNNTEEGKKELVKRTEKYLADIEKKRLRQAEKNKSAIEWQKTVLSGDKKKISKLKKELIDYSEVLQKKVNLIARLIDKGLPCLARKTLGKMHGGHINSVGGHKPIRYNLHNIHRQNAQSNHFQNEDGLLKEGLLNEYGLSYYEFVMGLRKCTYLGLTNLELQEKADIAGKIISKLNKADLQYSLDKRIELRNQINVELSIYSEEYSIFIN